jgi:hypothetical protein
MADNLDIIELRDRSLGDIFERLARRIRYKVEMEPRHPRRHGGKRSQKASATRIFTCG